MTSANFETACVICNLEVLQCAHAGSLLLLLLYLGAVPVLVTYKQHVALASVPARARQAFC